MARYDIEIIGLEMINEIWLGQEIAHAIAKYFTAEGLDDVFVKVIPLDNDLCEEHQIELKNCEFCNE
jgi:hypothetical protein